jgi:aldehyde dehydrogenase (NAD+)
MDKSNYHNAINKAFYAQDIWRTVPGPKRGELIRIFGNKLRKYKTELSKLVTQDSKNMQKV